MFRALNTNSILTTVRDIDTACDHKLVKHLPTMHMPVLTMEEKWR